MRSPSFSLPAWILLAAAAQGGESLPNLLPNPGFEALSGDRAVGWAPFEMGYAVDGQLRRSGTASARCENRTADDRRGATATVVLGQTAPAPVLITGWSRAENVGGFANNDYSIYVDLEYTDGTPLWGQTAPFATLTHDWQRKQVLIVPSKPLKLARIHALFRHHTGTAWFDDFSASVLAGDHLFDSQVVAPPRLPAGAGAGWFVRDVAADSEILPLAPGPGVPSEAETKLQVRMEGLEAANDGRVLSARILDLKGTARAVSVYHVERFEGTEPVWWNDVCSFAPVSAGERANLTRIGVGATGAISLYPFGCVTGGGKGLLAGMAPLQGPWIARIGFHAASRLLYAAFDLALVPENKANSDGKGHGLARISVVRSAIDPEWGFRAAALEFYRLFPEAYGRRATAEGIWIPFTDPSTVKGVEDFGIAYHEGDNSVESDDRLGILSFRYTEPMTWWMPMAKGTPRTYDSALDLVRRHAEGKDQGSRRLAQAVLLSGTHDEGGRFNVEFQNAPWTDGAVWVLNPNPALPHGPEEWTKGRLSYTKELADTLYGPGAKGAQDGEYLDSIEGWSDILDFRKESLERAASCPTFTTEAFRPVLPTWFSVWELTALMSEDLHRRGKLLMANSTPWRIHAFLPLLDVAGTETNWLPGGTWRPESDAIFNLRRTLSGRKPYLLLQNTDFEKFGIAEVERYFQRCMFYGVYPSMFSVDASTHPYWAEPRWYDRDRPLFKRYIPVVQKLSRAGWEPITLARSDKPAVHVERFGAGLLTLLNDSGAPVRAAIAIDMQKLGIQKGARIAVIDLVSGETLAGALGAEPARFEVTLRPEEARAVEIRVP